MYGTTNSPGYPFRQLVQKFQVAIRGTNPDMTIELDAMSDGRFT